MTLSISDLRTFLSTAEKLKSTLRHNWTTTGRQESTAEHTWRLLLLFSLVQESEHFAVDPVKMQTMLLIHDLCEVVHGDVPGFKKLASDKASEKEAAEFVFASLPIPLRERYLAILDEYDAQQSLESKLARALDRIETLLQHLEAGIEHLYKEELGAHTREYGKKEIAALGNPYVTSLYESIQGQLEPLLAQREKELATTEETPTEEVLLPLE
ncbi:HD domain-containing protein [Candidatus Woesebacteria bacterium]|nr:HD domain-containing protein [Candidatus Woesebacteria bacterium]